jgi:NADH-quinone oxidoreductase subunit M
MSDWPLLSMITFLPVVGAVFILFIGGDDKELVARQARIVALWTSLITLVLAVLLWIGFETGTASFQFVERVDWLPDFGISYYLGVDGISMLFVVLSAFLTPICVLASWEAITERVKEFMIAFLLLECMMIGVFCSLDMVLFYVFFEGMLIPMFLIIGAWGGPRRVYAAFKFFLYTLAGSVLFLIAILTMYLVGGTSEIPLLMEFDFDIGLQRWLWLALFASFAVKVPMWPVHTWLPDAHVEAPTAGSVILAGVLLKMGAYGFLRFSLPMLPDATAYFTPLIYTLSVVAVIYTSLVALMQEDMKKLIAYSSVAHMGFVTIGIFTLTTQGVEGGLMVMLSHGIVSSALFLCVGVVYDRMHSRRIDSYGGLVHRMPRYALVFMIFALASVGLPGTGGFIGELLVLVGVFQVNTWVATLAATGVVLGAAYMLWLYRRVIFGPLTKEELKGILDLSPREIVIFAPLVVIVFWMGIYPNAFLDVMHASVANLIEQSQPAAAAALAGR